MAQALFALIKKHRPDCALDVLAPQWSLPIVARMPQVRRGIASRTGHGEMGLGKRRRLGHMLRTAGYEQAIVLPRSFKSALIPWFAKIPRRTGFRGEMRFGLINDLRPFDRDMLDQTVKRFVALGMSGNAVLPEILNPVLTTSASNQARIVEALALEADLPVVVMMPGAEYGPAKCWPLSSFTALARLLGDAGFAVWVLGSNKDVAAGEQICASSNAVNCCGKTSLEDVIDLLALAQHAVSNDSGLMHIAAAVGVQVHAIYGSSSPIFTPPLTRQCTVHWLELECSPCFQRECPLQHLRCLRDISPAAVFAKID
jgi:heptosyltransferase-2